MAKKPKPCTEDGCELPKVRWSNVRCGWHWLLRQPIETQIHAAAWRLDQVPEGQRRPRVPKSEWPQGYRWCAGCQTMVPLFYVSGSRCKACSSRAQHGRHVEETYGLTTEGYAALLAAQGGRCAICWGVPRTKRLAVDHDHTSGAVRGLLCSRCNHDLLGAAHDDVEILRRAVAYLESPPWSQM